MNREIIDINDFTVLVELATSNEPTTDSCFFDEPVIAVAFYGSGNVNLNVKYGHKTKNFNHTKGLALAFYANDKVEFEHHVSSNRPLECIVIATSPKNLEQLPHLESELLRELLQQLIHPKDNYVEGPRFFMTPEMQTILNQIFHNKFTGKAKMMFFKTQISSLLAHFLGQLSLSTDQKIPEKERQQLQNAQQILIENLDNPPSLTELSKTIGLNTFKLKKNFKALFGVPVFKYLHNERLKKAHQLIRDEGYTIQEASWHVGYDSLSSFSNAFAKKFGYRPSEIKP